MIFRRLLRLLIWIPALAVMTIFALSNRQLVELDLFPTDVSIDIPLSAAIFTAMALGFFLGGIVVWFTALRYRRAAKRAQETIRQLEARVRAMTAPANGQLLLPPV